MKENNKIITIQEMIMRELERLDDNDYMKSNGTVEVARSNALSNQATTYLKAVNLQIRIMETADKKEMEVGKLGSSLGIM